MNLEHRCFLIAAYTILLFTLIPQSTDARVWTSTEGEKLEAIFEKLDGDKIQLRLKNGRSVIFPLSRLVKEDHEAAERFKLVGDDAMTVYSAKKIDYLLARNLGKAGIRSYNDRLPDDLFVRRVYLDIIGRIPTRAEFMKFAESARKDKR